MSTNDFIDTYIDTLGIRCECDNENQRESVFNTIIHLLKERKIVAIKYNNEHSTKYYQITDLFYGNTKLATIAKGYYQNEQNRFNPDYYYLNINFYGLKRYNNKKDEASHLLVRTITAFLNTYNIDFRLIELDIAMDIKRKINNILAVCINRSPNINYYPLGDMDSNGNMIQLDQGTYYIEKLNNKQKKNAMSRAYLYDKRQKEIHKYNRDIGFDLTRFEVKLQKRYFVKNRFGTLFIYKALRKYSILYFTDIKQKEQFIKKLNTTKKSRQRKKIRDKAVEDNHAILLTYNMNKVGDFLREIDTIKLDYQGNFIFTQHEEYLECMSKFNRKS